MKIVLSGDHATLVQYLLGELSPDEEERTEDRYMVDDAFSGLRDEVELALVDSYVSGTLSPEQREHFETRYLITANRREAVRAAYVLKVYRERIVQPDKRPVAAQVPQSRAARWPRRFFIQALAAGIVVAVLGGGLMWWVVRRQSTPVPLVAEYPPVEQHGTTPQQNTASRPVAPQPAPPVSRSPSLITPEKPKEHILASGRMKPTVQLPAPPDIKEFPLHLTTAATGGAIASPMPAAPPARKERVVVQDFDYSKVTTSVQAVFGRQQNIGKGIRSMLANTLAKQGDAVVVERSGINTLMMERMPKVRNPAGPEIATSIGRIGSADVLLTGDITVFGSDVKESPADQGLGNGLFGGAVAAMGASKPEDKAVVVISYRLVDAKTSRVIATGQVRGESVRKSKAFGAGFRGGTGDRKFDMTSSDFAGTIIGEATQDCVNKLAGILNTETAAMTKGAGSLEATVSDVFGSALTITAGSNYGVNQGDVFEILKVVPEVKDPSTGAVLSKITEKTGELTITDVQDKFASGTYQGTPPQAGYLARKKR